MVCGKPLYFFKSTVVSVHFHCTSTVCICSADWKILSSCTNHKFQGIQKMANTHFLERILALCVLKSTAESKGHFSGIHFQYISPPSAIAIFIASKHTATLTEQTSLKRCSFYTDSFRTDVYPLMFFKLVLVDL